jgi:hypothetical protein
MCANYPLSLSVSPLISVSSLSQRLSSLCLPCPMSPPCVFLCGFPLCLPLYLPSVFPSSPLSSSPILSLSTSIFGLLSLSSLFSFTQSVLLCLSSYISPSISTPLCLSLYLCTTCYYCYSREVKYIPIMKQKKEKGNFKVTYTLHKTFAFLPTKQL